MTQAWWIAALAMALGALLLLASARRDRLPPQISRRFAETLRAQGITLKTPRDAQGNVWLTRKIERVSGSEIEEVQRLLTQAGWGTAKTRFYFLAVGWLGPLGAALLSGLYAGMAGKAASDILLYVVFDFALVFIGMRRILRWCAARRQKAIRSEVVPLLHLLRMLFDAGLSLEHALQVVEQQARHLIPNMATELGTALKRIQAGQERGEALAEMAAPLEVPELHDTIAMLKQVTRYGGNIRDSLVEYTRLVEQRQISDLREYVSKLSAKMTVVMVVFLFPALMIFAAGPGFIGLANALRGMGG